MSEGQDKNYLFSMEAYSYSQGLDAILLMYKTAQGSLQIQHRNIENRKIEYYKAIDAGELPIGEWDEDGSCLWDQESIYRLDQLVIEDAHAELRVATAIAIYHHWERSIPNQREIHRCHKKLKNDAILNNIELHDDIDALQFVANYLKHGTEKWKIKLQECFPTQFKFSRLEDRQHLAWVRWLHLSDENILWFFEIAKKSKRPITNWLM